MKLVNRIITIVILTALLFHNSNAQSDLGLETKVSKEGLEPYCYTDSCFRAQFYQAEFYYEINNIDSSVLILDEIIKNSNYVENKEILVECYLLLSEALNYSMHFLQGYENLLQARSLLEGIRNESLKVDVDLQEAYMFRDLELNEEADEKCSQVLHYYRSYNDTLGIIESLLCFTGGTEESSAQINEKPIVEEIIRICEKYDDEDCFTFYHSQAYAILAFDEMMLDSLALAKLHARKALQYADIASISWLTFWPYLTLAESYLMEAKYDSAYYYLNKTDSLVHVEQDEFYAYRIYQLSIDYYAAIGNKEKELEFKDLAFEYKSSNDFDRDVQEAIRALYHEEKSTFEETERNSRISKIKISITYVVVSSIILFVAIGLIKRIKKKLVQSQSNVDAINEDYSKLFERFQLLQKEKSKTKQEHQEELEVSHGKAVQQKESYIALLEGFKKGFNSWEEFTYSFHNLNSVLLKKLETLPSELSQNEIKLVALTHIGLSNKEIASLQNIQVSSVIIAKSRLKKKLNLQDTSIDAYIKSL